MIDTIGRPLPVIATARRSYEILWHNRILLLRTLWFLSILVAVSDAMANRFFGLEFYPSKMKEILVSMPTNLKISYFLVFSISLICSISFSVSWRRHLLIHETPNAFFFKKPLWRYFGFGTSVSLIAAAFVVLLFLVMFFLGTTFGYKSPTLFFTIIKILILFIAAIVVLWLVRHILVFTAITIDNRDLNWRNANSLMRGNVWRFIGIWLLLFLPVTFVGECIGSIFLGFNLDPQSLLGAIFFGCLQAFTGLVQIILGASSAALVYDYLVRGGGPAQSTYSIQA